LPLPLPDVSTLKVYLHGMLSPAFVESSVCKLPAMVELFEFVVVELLVLDVLVLEEPVPEVLVLDVLVLEELVPEELALEVFVLDVPVLEELVLEVFVPVVLEFAAADALVFGN
jgi:hypothetical protein